MNLIKSLFKLCLLFQPSKAPTVHVINILSRCPAYCVGEPKSKFMKNVLKTLGKSGMHL
jgi:hypothetical protein